MTKQEAIKILEAKLACMERDMRTMGEQMEALRIAIDALESAQPDVPDINVGNKTFKVIDIKTGKEADPYEIALHEDWAKHLMYCDMEGFAVEEDGTLILLDECGRHKYCPEGRFEVRWDEG